MLLADFLFNEASRLEQTGPLLTQAKRFLKEQAILYPGDEVLRRLVAKQRQAARDHIYERITNSLGLGMRKKLDDLLEAKDTYFTSLRTLKQPPGRPSPAAILRLTTKLELIREIGALHIDLSWLNNNYQRSLARYVRHRSANRLKQLKSERRYAVLVCFLHQLYADEDVIAAHKRDLEVQGSHNVNYIKYWFNEDEGTIFCLFEAPNAEAGHMVHAEAHGVVADEIIEVKEGT